MTTAYLSLGSNLGDRLGYLTRAAHALTASHTQLVAVSSVYETAPQGKTDQPAFLNAVVAVETALGPEALLAHLMAAERALGRVRTERWGPRTIDIDLLLFGDQQVSTPVLTVPHPRLHERAFVLVPLLEIAPSLPYQAALAALEEQGVTPCRDARAFLGLIQAVQ